MCFCTFKSPKPVPSSILMCLYTLKPLKFGPFQLKWPSLLSNKYTYIQPTQINTQLHQICIQTLQTLNAILTTFKYAFVHPQCFNLQISKSLDTNWCSKHAPMHLQHPKGSSKPYNRSRSAPQPTNNEISNSITCMNGPHNLLKYNKTRDQIAQRHVNNTWSEMVTSTPPLALYCIFPPWFIQCIWKISTPTSHKPYGFIQTLFILIPSIMTILWLRAA